MSLPLGIPALVLSLVMLFGFNGALFYADASKAYVLQYPQGGTKTIVGENGVKVRGWATITSVDCEISIKHLVPDNWAAYQAGQWKDAEEGYMLAAGDFEFNDVIMADIGNVVIVDVCAQEGASDEFTNLIIKSKSEQGLVYNRIVPQINVAVKNTAKLMGAQDYIYGASSLYDQYFADQLANGTYALEIDSTSIRSSVIDSIGIGRSTTVQGGEEREQRVTYKIRRDDIGEEVRNNEGLARYGLTVLQADADNIVWEDAFETRRTEIQQIVANTQKSLEETRLAVQETERVRQQGEKDKAERQAELEKDQIEKVITAETKVKVAQQDNEAASILEQTALIEARTIETRAKAEAYKNRQLVSAGLTPQERAEIEKETAIKVAEQLAKIKLPNTVIIGGEEGTQGGEGLLTLLIGAELASKMVPTTP